MPIVKRRTTSDLAKDIEEEIKSPKQEKTRVEFLDSGSTVLNLVLSGKGRNGGWARGRVVNLIGDGSSGKTLLALETAALCFYRLNKSPETFPKVKNVFIVYNNVEGVMDFPLEEMYGKEFVGSVEWVQSSTVEEMGRDYTRRVKNLKEGDFLLYFVDSLDALVSEDAKERFEKAADKDTSEENTYGMEKQKYTGKFFGNLCSISKDKDATFVAISQVRDNIGVSFGKKYKRVGGKALDFYTHQCCWLAVKEKLSKTIKGEDRVYGVRVRAKLERSKVGKPFREADFVILFDYGIDDILSNIVYIYGEKTKKVKFDNQEFDSYDKLVKYIEENKLQSILIDMVEAKWNSIEEAIKVNRERKF
jgi:recombination protein RecA